MFPTFFLKKKKKKEISVKAKQSKLTCHHGCDPDSIKSHTSNVVELGLKALEGSATVVGKVAACRTSRVGAAAGNTVGQSEIDVSRFPVIDTCREGQSGYLSKKSE